MRGERVRLEDMAEAIKGIEQTLAGVDFAAFIDSWEKRRAVERGLEIVAEASRSLAEQMKADHPDVPWSQIAGIGNILRHEYHRVEPLIIWNIVFEHLPALSGAIQNMLAKRP